jgi:hypothetical protein
MDDKQADIPLVTEALQTASVRQLYEQVSALTPIEFKTAHAGSWKSETSDEKTTITVAPTKHPEAALAHELLHARLKISGYRQYVIAVSMDAKREALMRILPILDNELQHHRMFKDYVAAGLDPHHFYDDDDANSFHHVRQQLGQLHKDSPPEEFLRLFVTVLAPGGVGGDDERREIRSLFEQRCRAKTWAMLTKIEEAFQQWTDSDSLDAGPTVLKVFRVLGGYRRSWIGHTANSLADGRFVGERFILEEASNRLER